MATGTTLSSALEKISKNHLECSICQDRYDHPKILTCLHSFCVKCLENYRSTKYQDATEIPCPVCRRETQLPQTGVEGLKTNFHLIGLVEEIALQEKVASSSGTTELICEICDESQALHRCLDCALNLCSNCRKMHLRFPACSSHTVNDLEDNHQRKDTLENKNQEHHPKCPNHEGEVTRLFCTTCEELICQECTANAHSKPQHSYIDCSQAHKQWLAELSSPLQELLTEFREARGTVSTMKRKLGTVVDITMADVQDRAADLRAEVTSQENRLVESIKNTQQNRDQTFDEYEKTFATISERLEYSLETATDVASTASDCDFLSLYPTISKDLKSLGRQAHPEIDRTLSCMWLKQSQSVGDIKLGRLELGGKWELCPQFGEAGSLEKPHAYDVAALQPGEIVVCCNSDYYGGPRKVDVLCSTTGTKKGPIASMRAGTHVAAKRGRVVFCDESKGAKVINRDNTLAFEFQTVPESEIGKTAVEIKGVAVKNDDTIILGDVKRKVLTEHHSTDGSLIRTIPVKLPPHWLAVDSNDRVVISGGSQEVAVADSDGVTLFSIKPTIEDQPVNCRGVCCHSSSDIYVAMKKGELGHIHHYSTSGRFIRCVVQGLKNPLGITFTADGQKLAVADWKDSVKMYH